MKKHLNTIALLCAVLMLLTSCTSKSTGIANSGQNNTHHFDYDKFKNDYLTEDILETLNSNIEAIESKDKEKFIKTFNPESVDNNLFWLDEGKSYKFIDIVYTEKQDKRINVIVEYRITDTNGLEEKQAAYYTFLENSDNEWKIAIID